jgi:ferritin
MLMSLSRRFSSLLKASVNEALNRQVFVEMEASITYMRVSSWFDEKNLTGIAGMMKKES